MLTVSDALQAYLDAQSTGLAYVVELRPRRNALPNTAEIILDCDTQSSSLITDQTQLVHRVDRPAGIGPRDNDETASSGVTRRVFGHSTVFATYLDGASDSKVVLGSGLALLRSGAVVVEFRADDLRDCDMLSIQTSDGTYTALRVRLKSDGNACATLVAETTAGSSGAEYEPGRWHRLVCTYAGDVGGDDSALKLYLDGTEILSTTSTAHMVDLGVSPVTGLWQLVLGNNQADTGAFAGRLGRVIVWTNNTSTAPLDASDVLDIETHLRGPLVACSGDQPILDYALSVSEVAPIGNTIDPQTRVKKRDRFEITWSDDGWLRYQKERFREASFSVAVKLAHADLDPDDFLLLANGYVEEGLPGEDFLTMTVREPELSLEATAQGAFIGHPLEVAKKLLEAAGVHPSKWDADSLDPTAYPEIGHFQVARYGTPAGWSTAISRDIQGAIQERTPIRPLLDELAMLCGGAFVADEGQLRFAKYDPTTAAVAHWTSNDVSDLEQPETLTALANRYVLPAFFLRGDPLANLVVESKADQLGSAIGGLEPRVSSQEVQAREWVRSVAMIRGQQTLTGGGPWDRDVLCGALGLSGHGLSDAQRVEGGTQDAIYQLSDTKPAYYMVGRTERNSDGQYTQPNPGVEIVRVEDVALEWGSGLTLFVSGVPDPVTNDVHFFPRDSTITITDRAQYGTTAQTEPYRDLSYLADVTLPLYALEQRLARFANGCPILRFRTNLAKIAVNLGEFVTIEDELVLDFGIDGVDETTKWEVIGKEVDVLGDTLGILWTVARVVETSPAASAARTSSLISGLTGLVGEEALPLRVADPDSFVVTQTTGLAFAVSSGRAGTLAGELEGPAFEGSVAASKDSYLGFDLATGLFVMASVSNGGTPPTFDSAILPVATMVSDGTEITSIVRTAPTAGLAAGSVHIDQLSTDVADETQGLVWGDNGLRVLPDGVTIDFNVAGELEAIGGSGAPTDAEYVVAASHAGLSAERVLTAGTGFAVDNATPGQSIVKLAAGYGLLSSLTSGRVPVASGAAALTDYSSLTYDGTSFHATRLQASNSGTGAPIVAGNQSSAGPTPPTGTVVHLVGADAAVANVDFDTFGAEGQVIARRSEGTLASPTQLTAGKRILRLEVQGRDNAATYRALGRLTFENNTNVTSTTLSSTLTVALGISSLSDVFQFQPQRINSAPLARTSGSNTIWQFTAPACTALTASTNAPSSRWSGGSQQHSAGAGPTRSATHEFLSKTYSAGSASTWPLIACGYDEAPTAGTNMTITLPLARHFLGSVYVESGRVLQTKGTDVASANDMTLGAGNLFAVTGTTEIRGIATAGWTAGSEATLIFASTPTVKHNYTTPGAGFAKIKLSGSADLVAAADTVLTLVYDGTCWQEKARKVA